MNVTKSPNIAKKNFNVFRLYLQRIEKLCMVLKIKGMLSSFVRNFKSNFLSDIKNAGLYMQYIYYPKTNDPSH